MKKYSDMNAEEINTDTAFTDKIDELMRQAMKIGCEPLPCPSEGRHTKFVEIYS